jgi:hypothetical protein
MVAQVTSPASLHPCGLRRKSGAPVDGECVNDIRVLSM